MGNFHFFIGRAGKLTFFGGGYNFKTGYLVTILGHIQACPTRFWRKRRLLYCEKKVAPKKKPLFLWPSGSELVYNNILIIYFYPGYRLGSPRLGKTGFLFGHLFFNITDVFCAKKRVGHACICPRMVTG